MQGMLCTRFMDRFGDFCALRSCGFLGVLGLGGRWQGMIPAIAAEARFFLGEGDRLFLGEGERLFLGEGVRLLHGIISTGVLDGALLPSDLSRAAARSAEWLPMWTFS